jgi:hypothetical protein
VGYGALIGGIISAVGSTAGSLLSSSGASQVNAGAVSEGHQINLARNRYISPFLDRSFWNLDMPGAVQQSLSTGLQYAPQFNQANMAQLQSLLGQALPGYQGLVGQMATNLGSMLQGNVPADVQNQLQRFGAQQALTSGIGAGGLGTLATGRDITARDLGLTSLSLMQSAQQQLPGMIGMARNYLMPQPVSAQSVLPFADIIAGRQWTDQAQFEANLAAYNASLASAEASAGQVPTTSGFGQAASTIGGLMQGLGQTSPQTGKTGYGMLGDLFSGQAFGGGGSTGGGIMDQYLGGLGGSFGY